MSLNIIIIIKHTMSLRFLPFYCGSGHILDSHQSIICNCPIPLSMTLERLWKALDSILPISDMNREFEFIQHTAASSSCNSNSRRPQQLTGNMHVADFTITLPLCIINII